MGDPRKQRKKFAKPPHMWQKDRLDDEKKLVKEYGFRNKEEIWKMKSILKGFFDQTKNLIALTTPQGEKEKKLLLLKLQNMGLTKKASQLEDVLGLGLRDLLERRLQTLVYKKNLADSVKQARQFIVHEHIAIGDKKITAPSYLVSTKEESAITFAIDSEYNSPDHPMRQPKEK